MTRILNIIGTDFDSSRGGVVAFLKNYLNHFSNDDELKFDILSFSQEDNILNQQKMVLMGNSELYVFPKLSVKSIDVIKGCFVELLDNYHYDIIHLHSANMGFLFLPIAKDKGVEKIIVHSHNTKLSESGIKSVRNRFFCMYNEKFLTHRAACSAEAGVSMFGKKTFSIIPNSIETSQFCFNNEARIKIRNLYNIAENDLLIGTVGRLCKQKNQLFMLKVMKKIITSNPNMKFIIVGDGEDKKRINDWIKKHHMENHIYMAGHRQNINEFLSAFDIFVLPSIFEGFGIALLEAVSCGLPCICSDRVAFPSNIGNVKKIPLKQKVWIEYLTNQKMTDRFFYPVSDTIYDLQNGNKYFKDWYLQ